MRLPISPMRFLLPAALLLAVPSCAPRERIRPLFPPVADMVVEARPVPTPEILTSEAAADAFDASLKAWGRRGWQKVGRICRWSKANGLSIECPPAEEAAR